jgi:glycosyltransferase involved in cell wall biosynthesis
MYKHKILFVVGGLHRAGAERFAYEIDLSLNKHDFEISILCLEDKDVISKKWQERYYEKKHEALGTKITFMDSFKYKQSSSLIVRIFHKVTFRKFKKSKKRFNSKLSSFLNQFDVIHWIGEYTFIHSIPDNIKEKSLISSMSAKFQDINLYNNYDFDFLYNFISGFRLDDGEYNDFKKIKHTHFPLVLNIVEKTNQWKFQGNKIKKIGIFTRLDRYKPLDPFFYAFQLLLDQIPNCELHIYGNGDPVLEGMILYLDRLGITDRVFFRGHQDDIVKTVREEHIDLSWFQGYNSDRPSGYAGLDICTTGTPLICWDFHSKPCNPFNTTYPHFKNLNNFVNYSLEILTNKEKAEALSINQFKEVYKTNYIYNYLSILEDLYKNISKLN